MVSHGFSHYILFFACVKYLREINAFLFIATFLYPVFQKIALLKVFLFLTPQIRVNFRKNKNRSENRESSSENLEKMVVGDW